MKKELNENSSSEDLFEFASSWGYGDEEGMDASPSWMSQELQERGIYKKEDLYKKTNMKKSSWEITEQNKETQTWSNGEVEYVFPNMIYDIIYEIGKRKGFIESSNILHESKLSYILSHFHYRGIGNTTAELEGVKNVDDAVLIVSNVEQANVFNIEKNKVISIHELDKLRGRRIPIVIDHFALDSLFLEIGKKLADNFEYKTEPYEYKRS